MSPALETMRNEGMVFPKGWNAKSRCRPKWETQKSEIEEKVFALEEEVMKKVAGDGRSAKIVLDWGFMERTFEEGGGRHDEQVSEEEVTRWKERWRDFIRSPIDKYPGEMAVI